MKRRYGYGWGSSSESGSDEEREPPEIETGRKNLTDGDCKIVSKVFNDR